jgi:hypothetical protein
MHLPNFKNVERFFKSWGMYPANENTDNFNPEVIGQGINRACFKKMCEQADEETGRSFRTWVRKAVNATDDAFYVKFDTWKELEDYWFECDAPGN